MSDTKFLINLAGEMFVKGELNATTYIETLDSLGFDGDMTELW